MVLVKLDKDDEIIVEKLAEIPKQCKWIRKNKNKEGKTNE